tara:strand:- start:1927 stop:2205 length:279 start_codon:yes stop_codon:yes gene_type:complete
MEKKYRILALFDPDGVLTREALETYVGRPARLYKLKYSTYKDTYSIGWIFEKDELNKALGAFTILAGFTDHALHELELREAIEPILEIAGLE